jgi:hypothetical protein
MNKPKKMYVIVLNNYPEPNEVGGVYSSKEALRVAINEFMLKKIFRESRNDPNGDNYKLKVIRENSKYFTSYEPNVRDIKLSEEYKSSEELVNFWKKTFNSRECFRYEWLPNFEILEFEIDKEVSFQSY